MSKTWTRAMGAMMVATLAGCALAQAPANSPAPASGVLQTGSAIAQPERDTSAWPLVFEKLHHDFGRIDDVSAVEFKFQFTNRSARELTITNIRTSCGCSAATPGNDKRIYRPGETGSINVRFDPKGRRGEERKTVTVETDDPQVKAMELTLRSQVVPRIMAEPTTVYFGEMKVGETPRTQELVITAREQAFEIKSTALADQRVKLEDMGRELTNIDGAPVVRYKYRVTTPADLAEGTWQTTLSLVTNDGLMPSMSVPLVASVVGPFQVMPERALVRMSGGGQPWSHEVVVTTRDKQPFNIKSVASYDVPPEMSIIADVQPVAAGNNAALRVRVSGVTPRLITDIKGGLLLRTDRADKPEIRVPLMGWWVGQMAPQNIPGVGGGPVQAPAPAKAK